MAIEGNTLVLGASGMVGSEVCAMLRRNDVSVTGAARFRFPGAQMDLEELGVTCVEFDAVWDDPIELPDARQVVFEIWDPSQHSVSPDDANARKAMWKLNYEAIGKVAMRYTTGRKRRPKPPALLINGSSGNVYGSHPDPRSERDALIPDTEYGRARMAQELLLQFLATQAETRCVNLRYYHSNAPDRGVLRKLADTILKGESLGDAPDQRIQVIGLDDFVRYTVLATESADRIPEAINICHPTIWTMRGLANRLRDILGEGDVRFDRDTGGTERSVIGNPAKVIELFGEPLQELTPLMEEVCAAAKEALAEQEPTA